MILLSWVYPALLGLFFSATAAPSTCVPPRPIFTAQDQSAVLGPCRHFQGFAIQKSRIAKTSLRTAIFEDVDVEKTDWEQVDFTGTHFLATHFRQVRARKNFFESTVWRGGEIQNSDLSGSFFDSSQFHGTRWYQVNFAAASLKKIKADHCYLQQVNFEGADLRGAHFANCVFVAVTWRRALFNDETQLPFSKVEKAHLGMVYQP